jgi:hypothetical protein
VDLKSINQELKNKKMVTNHIHILIPGIYKTHQELCLSSMASIRLRSAIVAKYLSQHGSTISVGEFVSEISNIILVGKITVSDIKKRTKLWLDQIQSAKNKNVKIFVDYTDHHLYSESPMRIFYESALKLADCVITSSNYLKILLNNSYYKEIFVIPDAIDVPILSPKISKTNRILWFGHPSNIKYLIKFIENYTKIDNFFQLTILSNDIGLNILSNHQFQTRVGFKIELQKWSVEALIAASKISDICIIPSDPKDSKKSGASSNRLITAIALGLPTAAELLPSYEEFSKYFFNIRSNSLLEIISNSSSSEFRKLISEAQEKIVPKFSQQSIGQQWIELFRIA